mmetsp:Transcript_6803/g.21215  ORF Transcript_6803/g.21215 Transcript_6803/m.21215 type:complete len:211 (-) Transcript_6803:1723-2355(-)
MSCGSSSTTSRPSLRPSARSLRPTTMAGRTTCKRGLGAGPTPGGGRHCASPWPAGMASARPWSWTCHSPWVRCSGRGAGTATTSRSRSQRGRAARRSAAATRTSMAASWCRCPRTCGSCRSSGAATGNSWRSCSVASSQGSTCRGRCCSGRARTSWTSSYCSAASARPPSSEPTCSPWLAPASWAAPWPSSRPRPAPRPWHWRRASWRPS